MITVASIVFWASVAVFAYAVGIYNGLMILLGRRKAPAPSIASDPPFVTLIIPAYNEENVLAEKLENALCIDYPRNRLEIVVASDGSSDATASIARRYLASGVRLLDFPLRRGKASVLNDAVAESRGEVLCFCDANVMFRPDALARLLARLADRRVGAVSGDVRIASHEADFGKGESSYYRLERAVQLGESRIGSMMGVDGGLYVVRRSLFQPLPPDTILDDFVLTMHVIRQGFRVIYEPSAVATENATPSSAAEYRRRARISAGAVQSCKRRQWPPLSAPIELAQYISHKLLRWLGPVFLALLLASNACLWSVHPFYRVIFVCQVVAYASALLGAVSQRARQTTVIGVAFYFVMSHVAMAAGLVKGALNRQHVTWTPADRPTVFVDAPSAELAVER